VPGQICFIVNPRSGHAARALPAVRTFAASHGAPVHLTERPRHAGELAAQALADGCATVVAVGGDGTMNEIASVLVGTPATLGLIPCGSGDGLGRHLGIHGSITRALALLDTGRPRLIDTGLADGHPFFTAAGLGFEAYVAERFNRLDRRGLPGYLATSANALLRYRPEEYTLVHGANRERVRAFTLAVANANQYGNQARIAPHAQVDDGRLDLTVVPPIRIHNGLPLLVRLFNGTVDRVRGVTLRQAAQFTVERSAPGPIHTDGEIHAAGRIVEFAVRPASLRIVAP
jgi:diacylglycerol kinase family enzyme